MGGANQTLTGPDLSNGISIADVADGATLLGHAGGEPVLVARRGDEVFAIGATCTHYGGPLAEGLFVGDEVRCPWHHACFSIRTGEPLAAPALNPVDCWKVDRTGDRFFVREKLVRPRKSAVVTAPSSVVIVGAGAAGHAAAEMLRREGYDGTVVMLGADPSVPYDRPNISKDYLAGTAPEEWIPLRPAEYYTEHRIELRTGTTVSSIDTKGNRVALADGQSMEYGALLLTTGAEPIRLSVPGADQPHVRYLRTLADSRGIIALADASRPAVVIGSSFIGLEVAASLRARGVPVTVVAPESVPLERVMGAQVGAMVRKVHEEHGVVFQLGRTAKAIDADGVTLDNGQKIPAKLVVIGIGVRPATDLAERAGMATDRGVSVNEYLETSVSGVYAAGDIARYPDPYSAKPVRVEHWVVAQRQGQTAAKNMLGQKVPFRFVPFFWSNHYDLSISYVGHAESWDREDVAGSIADRDCAVAYRQAGRTLAVATIGRDNVSLRAEAALASGNHGELAALIPPSAPSA